MFALYVKTTKVIEVLHHRSNLHARSRITHVSFYFSIRQIRGIFIGAGEQRYKMREIYARLRRGLLSVTLHNNIGRFDDVNAS